MGAATIILTMIACLYPSRALPDTLSEEQLAFARAARLEANGDLAGAEMEFLTARTLARRMSVEDYHPEVLVLWNLGRLYSKEKKLEKAEEIYKERLKILETKSKPADLELGTALFDLQGLYEGMDREADAKAMMQRGVDFYNSCKRSRQAGAVCDRRLADVQGLYGDYLFNKHQFAEAEPYLEAVASRSDKDVSPEILDSALAALALIYVQKGETDQARTIWQRRERIRTINSPSVSRE
ncbi:MAG: tetratricopeptide repeat protein [Acidobacteriota bacterium]|nr:tetratricopeptide repeat protein [Acidobacteriota bacterium]